MVEKVNYFIFQRQKKELFSIRHWGQTAVLLLLQMIQVYDNVLFWCWHEHHKIVIDIIIFLTSKFLGDFELILKKRDAADQQFFQLQDGNLVVKERFSSLFLSHNLWLINYDS